MTTAPDLPARAGSAPTLRRRRRWPRLKAGRLLIWFSAGWLALMLMAALGADYLAPYAYDALDLRQRLAPPAGLGGGMLHPLGTDDLGRDMLSRLLVSIRISLTIAFASTAIAMVIGTTAGFLAAHFRGWIEQALLVLIDLQAAIPFMIFALAVLAFFGNDLLLFVVLMGFHGWEKIARIARGLALSAGGQGYVAAAGDLGAGPVRIYLRHVLPNMAGTLIVSATLNFPEIMLIESGLSFLGLGVQPPLASLGNMVGYGRDYLEVAPWIPLLPALVIVTTALAVGLLGDLLRDRLDAPLA
ncbi:MULTISPECIES: ABC transporter permease [Tistrella]|jgi:peptide/nickel transport system permease protein|uniref:ABC transporter permease n=1 Tax=Tistrella arctica TaxID=3133430 RepID=A0ABU9YL37_9PROT